MTSASKIPEILRRHESEILTDWMRQQLSSTTVRSGVIRENDLREQSRSLLSALREALETGSVSDITGSAWSNVRDFLMEVSRSRGRQGFTSAETAMFVLSLKLPLFARLRQEYGSDAAA